MGACIVPSLQKEEATPDGADEAIKNTISQLGPNKEASSG